MTTRRRTISLITMLVLSLGGVLTTLLGGWTPGLGLDLKGGASVVLQPATKVKADALDQTIRIIRRRVDGLGVAEPEITRQGDSIVVALPGVTNKKRALELVGRTAQLNFRGVVQQLQPLSEILAATTLPKGATTTIAGGTTTTVAGVKIQTGSTVVVGATSPSVVSTSAAPTSAAPGVAAAPAGGPNRYSIGLTAPATTGVPPTTKGPTATTSATTTATTTAVTTAATSAGGATTTAPFAVLPGGSSLPPGITIPVPTGTPTAQITIPVTPSPECDQTSFPDLSRNSKPEEDLPNKQVILEGDRARYLLGCSEMDGTIVSSADAVVDQGGNWQVQLRFTGPGNTKWNAAAQKFCQRQLAIVLDGVVQSAPVIQSPCRFDRAEAQITGNFSEKQARDLALVLRYGALPVKLVPQTVQDVSASVGRDSLRAGVITGLLGLLLVAAYMLFFYRGLGFIVIAGLTVAFGLMWSIITWLSKSSGLSLTLSGAVGIIVSVGITVDSYVVYFERMRDEVRNGRTVRSAVDRGFTRAWRTIWTADLTSLVGAAVLYWRTVGSVRGFAFFLALSTLLDLLVSYFFVRPLVHLAGEKGWFRSAFGRHVPLEEPPGSRPTTTGRLVPTGARSRSGEST